MCNYDQNMTVLPLNGGVAIVSLEMVKNLYTPESIQAYSSLVSPALKCDCQPAVVVLIECGWSLLLSFTN